MDDFDLRSVLDWDYYKQWFSKTVQKIITIPAALQDVQNPVPRIPHPEWLFKTLRRKHDKFQQQSLVSMFQVARAMNDVAQDKNSGSHNLQDI
jgi:DNA polymerase epsilon subunit 1